MPRSVAEKHELLGRLSCRIQLAQKRLRPLQSLIAAYVPEKALRQQELRHLYILSRLQEILLIGHSKAKLMTWQLIERGGLYVLNEFVIAADKALVLRKPALPKSTRDRIEQSLVTREFVAILEGHPGGRGPEG